MSPLISEAASAEPISDVRPAVATAPASAIVPKKSRRPILLSICNPISQSLRCGEQIISFQHACKERASVLVDDNNRPSATHDADRLRQVESCAPCREFQRKTLMRRVTKSNRLLISVLPDINV
jgi:hypothetical protein